MYNFVKDLNKFDKYSQLNLFDMLKFLTKKKHDKLSIHFFPNNYNYYNMIGGIIILKSFLQNMCNC